jgi:cobalt-zinc-cadmium resistance protein CzcA
MKIKLQSQYNEFIQEGKHEETIAYFESKALKNVDLVTKAANDKFINGDINYLEWVMLINQNTEIQSNYIETVRKFNETILKLENLISK